MQVFSLALKNIRGSGFRSLAVFLAVMAVAGFLLATTLIIRGSQYSLDSGLNRLGADIVVVPSGTEDKVETALLMGKPTNVWMPAQNVQGVQAVPGVQSVSAQVFLASLYGASCCAVSEMFMVVYDPSTDFTINPWLHKNLGRPLARGEAIGGADVFVPEGQTFIKLYGYDISLVGNLARTGTGIDQTLFLTMETAQDMAKSSVTTALQPLVINPGQISTIMVKVAPSTNIHQVAQDILQSNTGVVPIESPNLFGAFRDQMNGLLRGFLVITIVVWAIAMVLIGLIFSMAAHDRRREMSVLRAVGATRSFVFREVIAEAVLLALVGSVCGIAVSALGIYLFKDYLAESLKMPFLFPSIPAFMALFSVGVAAAIVTVTLAALIPAYRASRQELAIAMRE